MGIPFHWMVGCTQNYGYEFWEKIKRNVVIVGQPEEEFTLMCGVGLLFRNILSYSA